MPATQALQLEILLLFEFDQDSEQSPMFVLRATTDDVGQKASISVDETILSLFDQTREFSLIENVSDSYGKIKPLASLLAAQGYISALMAPIRYDERLMGCLVGCTRIRQNFSSADLSLFSMFGSYVATTMENAYLRTETAFRSSEAMSLQTVSSALVEKRSLNTILSLIVDEASRVIKARDILILLLEENGQSFRISARKDRKKPRNGRLSVKDSLNGLVVKSGQPLVSQDAMTDARANKKRAQRLGVRTVAIAPLRIRDRIIGTIAAHNKRDDYFSRADVEALCSFANQAAIAIDNAQLFNELLQARDEIEQKAGELQELLAETLNVQEAERRRIAADIHDRVVTLIIGALYETETCARFYQTPVDSHNHLELIQQLLNEAVEKIRRSIRNLWPATLDQIGLIPSLKDLLAQQKKVSGLPYQLRVHGTPSELPTPVNVAIYRIVQEALNNVHRHADATSVDLVARFSPRHIRFIVRDDGSGFNVNNMSHSPPRSHFGLLSMRERVLSIGGRLEIKSEPGLGTEVIIELPWNSVSMQKEELEK
jgi:signal transduction histidine kinase